MGSNQKIRLFKSGISTETDLYYVTTKYSNDSRSITLKESYLLTFSFLWIPSASADPIRSIWFDFSFSPCL